MQDIRKQRRAEKDANLQAKQCVRCQRWFTVKGNQRTDKCFRCEELEDGQAGKQ
jgi:hypothetical protein